MEFESGVVYCWKCGAELQANVSYCAKCGAPVQSYATSSSVGSTMAGTGFEQLSVRKDAQDLWLRRVIAFIIDAVIVGVAAGIIGFAIAVPFFVLNQPFSGFGWLWFWGLAPLLIVAYFVLAEAGWSQTIGKNVMGIRSVKVNGSRLDLVSSFLRNISKINWVLLILDVLVGLIMQGDGRQKFSDRLAGTTVESVRESSRIIR